MVPFARTPLEIMTVIRGTRPIMQVDIFETSVTTTKLILLARAAQIIHIEKWQRALNQLHKFVAQRIDQRHFLSIPTHNKVTYILSFSLTLDDFFQIRSTGDHIYRL